MDNSDKRLRLIIGRAGSGKDYFVKVFGLKNPPSYTTRPMRKDDVDGVSHTFVTDEFYHSVNKDEMAAYTFYHGYHYWTTFDMLLDCNCYLIDPQGVEFLLSNKHRLSNGFVIVLVVCPLWKRIHHMRMRGTTWRLILSRVISDRKVFRRFEKSGNYDYRINM